MKPPDAPQQRRDPLAGYGPSAPVSAPRRTARGTGHPPLALAAPELATGDGMFREPWLMTWARRAVTVPGLFAVTALWLAVLPVLVVGGAAVDVVKRRPMILPRFALMIAAVLVLHIVGLTMLFALWIGAVVTAQRDPARWRAWNRWLETWWTTKVVEWSCAVYGMRLEIEGIDAARPGPILLLSRHAATVDTLLPISLVGGAHGSVMRIVKKRELLWDPCVDVIGKRLPTAFVRRGSGDPEREIAGLARLVEGVTEKDAILVFPEGTRFTVAKQQRILARLRERQPQAAERAARLRNVLPAKPGGALALLERRPDLDVVFLAHTGLEGAARLEHLIAGSLLGRTLRFKFWRVAARDIPRGRDARAAWLADQWQRVDDWIQAHQAN